jgi:hypothetical protein
LEEFGELRDTWNGFLEEREEAARVRGLMR